MTSPFFDRLLLALTYILVLAFLLQMAYFDAIWVHFLGLPAFSWYFISFLAIGEFRRRGINRRSILRAVVFPIVLFYAAFWVKEVFFPHWGEVSR